MSLRACACQHARRRGLCLILLITVACLALLFPGCRSSKPDPFAGLVIKESKTGQYDEIKVAPGFLLLSNMWATIDETNQKICLYEDGSYSWEWQRGDSGVGNPNYPEVIYGVKPWGQGSDGLLLPKQLKDISSLLMELDFDYKVTNQTGWWYATVEFFLTDEKPTPGQDIHGKTTDEIMIYFDWKGDPIGPEFKNRIVNEGYSYAWTRREGNWGDAGWNYSQFSIVEKGTIPDKVDLKLFLDHINSIYGLSNDLWLGAVEFGIMYYDQTAGWGLVKKFDLVINGERVSSGRQ